MFTGQAPASRRALWEGSVLSQNVPAATFKAAHAAPIGQPGLGSEGRDRSRIDRSDSLGADDLLARILVSLDDDKAEDVVSIDLRGRSEIADHMVIASGRSSRQVASISEKLIERLKADCGISARIEGKDQGDWVLIDAGDAVIHVFRPEVREFYQLEKMWQPGSTHRTPGPA